ncbi:3'-5' exonuclease [Streptomyces sp. A012304]|uniref:3'-5' exonuclease n=1 Tax=Streptomyces sp. A012304 TaxID=375446 RepID=UPI00222F0341|nr:3'-5' exonuclease [Streptomyces sp. A012304]GKQ39522.1 3'-5' exonuclease [Streptomyces sp. A012304]
MWHTGRLAGFDTESTGIDVETDRIVTAGIVEVGGSTPPAAANWLINPGVEIPEQATAVHGITTEYARAHGQDAAEGIAELVDGLVQLVLAGTPLVIMNAPFDLTLLDREARRYGIKTLTDIVGDELHVVDPRVLDKRVDPYRRGKRTLTDLCAHYQVQLEGAHSADADALAACRVAWRIASQYGEIGNAFLHELHEQQEDWAAAQAASFQAYLRKANPDAVVDGSWPLRPVGGAA